MLDFGFAHYLVGEVDAVSNLRGSLLYIFFSSSSKILLLCGLPSPVKTCYSFEGGRHENPRKAKRRREGKEKRKRKKGNRGT